MKVAGVLMEMYDGTFLIHNQIILGFGLDTFEEVFKKRLYYKSRFIQFRSTNVSNNTYWKVGI